MLSRQVISKIGIKNSLFRFNQFNLSAVLCSFLLIFIFVGTYFVFVRHRESSIEQTRSSATRISSIMRYYVEGLIHNSEDQMGRAELYLHGIKPNLINNQLSEKLASLIAEIPEFELMGITNSEGEYIGSTEWLKHAGHLDTVKKINVSDRDYFKALKNDSNLNIYISKPLLSKSTGHSIVVVARRLYNINKKFDGIVVMTILTSKISEFFAKTNPIPNSTLALYSTENVLYSRSPMVLDTVGKQIGMIEELKPLVEKKIELGSFQGLCPIDKVQKIYGYSNLSELGLKILWGKPLEIVLDEARADMNPYLLFDFFFLIFIIVFHILFFKKLVKEEGRQNSELANAQLIALGELAAGIAHEINNPLAVIIGKVDLLFRKNSGLMTPESRTHVESIKVTALRIAKIVAGLKNLSRQSSDDQFESFQLGKIISEVSSVLDFQLRNSKIKLEVNVDPMLLVIGRPHQIAQVFLNLFSNSIYAIKNQEDPWVRISCSCAFEKVSISFVDSGLGIPIENQQKILNPFFTTKPTGEGTGLGLSISKKILIDNGGTLDLDSTSKHTKFILTLKLSPAKSIAA